MEVTLLTISKQCSDIIATNYVTLSINRSVLSELYDRIYDLYPTVDREEYNLYWRYNNDVFIEICDYLSYSVILTLMAYKTVFLVLNDCDEHFEENVKYLKEWDKQELEEIRERERDIYDVKIIGKEENQEEKRQDLNDEILSEPRTDAQIISYAIRKLPEIKYFTSDLIYKANLVGTLKKGWVKIKVKLTPLNEEVIERVVAKKTSKKGSSKGKKGSKSDKSSKKSNKKKK